jgi:two-component system chemotaxis response regulator CheB
MRPAIRPEPGDAEAPKVTAPIRVMLVDDSGVSRALMKNWLAETGQVDIVAVASNGRDAIEAARSCKPDVVVLDIEMPALDGLSALPDILAAAPRTRVLMASSLTTRSARVTFEAFSLGATDAIAKPAAGWASAGGPEFRDEFVRKVIALAPATTSHELPSVPAIGDTGIRASTVASAPPIRRAEPSSSRPSVLVIGASTGGPNALFELIAGLPKPIPVPVLVTQHMPPTFTAILAEHIGRRAGVEAFEGTQQMLLEVGKVYVAPGGRHMEAVRVGRQFRLNLTEAPPENFCRPSVNPLFRSAAEAWGGGVVAVMLTGMGSDGLDGAREVVACGGTVLAQDQASSVVWGMPGAVVKAGLAAEVLPVAGLASAIGCLLEGAR